MNAKQIANSSLPVLLTVGAVFCLATGKTEAGLALLTAVATHFFPSPATPKSEGDQ